MVRSLRLFAVMAVGLSCGLLMPAVASAATARATSPPAISFGHRGVAAAGAAAIPNIPSSGTFQIHNYLAAGKCIGISTNGYAGSWYCTTNPDQTWHRGNVNLDGYQLVNGDGQCLGVDGGSTSLGARIRAWSCNGHSDQNWFYDYSRGYFTNSGTGLVIGIWRASTANGASLVQWSENTNGDQYWY
jgi:hypothetical protein